MRSGWAAPRRWVRVGLWLLVPTLVLDWFPELPATVSVVAFAVGVLGMVGIAAATVAGVLGRSRVAAVLVGLVLLLGGLALFELDPFPASIAAIGSWWPAAITQPQVVGSAWWTTAALGVTLTGVGMLAAALVVAVTRGPRTTRP